MRPNYKLGVVFILMGAVLILSALSLFGYNCFKDNQAGKSSEEMLLLLKDYPVESRPVETFTTSAVTSDISNETQPIIPTETAEVQEMREVEINGDFFVGYISIPKFELELPINADWDYVKLQASPCRQNGSTRTDDLIIMAHNYYNHFGRLGSLVHGDEVIITDMDGEKFHYEVSYLEKINPDNPSAILESDNDLVLYTCTPGGALRQVVFCNKQI